jgi:hypothetical protein
VNVGIARAAEPARVVLVGHDEKHIRSFSCHPASSLA